jgi:hypothetical protein
MLNQRRKMNPGRNSEKGRMKTSAVSRKLYCNYYGGNMQK